MPKTKKTTKYLVPTVFAAVLVCALVMGVLYIRTYLMKQTIQERSYQLEEMVSQIQVNLHCLQEKGQGICTLGSGNCCRFRAGKRTP